MQTNAKIPDVLRGAAALQEALDLIGETEGGGDRALARIVVEHEIVLREMLGFVLECSAGEMFPKIAVARAA